MFGSLQCSDADEVGSGVEEIDCFGWEIDHAASFGERVAVERD